MAYIKVDHSKFKSTAEEIDKYVKNMKNSMGDGQREIDLIARNWQGADYMEYRAQWYKLNDSDSTYYAMKEALESYSEFLKFAEEKYKKAQSNAVNRGNSLPRW